jgi:putative tryptophan/tyrosine transport system substrate-binding protein
VISSIVRRRFLTALGSTAAASLLRLGAVCAQQPAMPVVGFVNSISAQAQALVAAAYRRGLSETGFTEDKNVAIESRWADGQYDRLPELVAELIGRNVSVIMAGGPPAARIAKAATATIPIVFTTGDDPVAMGLVASLNRPGGNATGIHNFFTELESKKLCLLRELMPQAVAIAALVNPNFPTVDSQTRELQRAAHALGLEIQIFSAGSERDLDTAFASIAQAHVGALLVGSDPLFNARRDQVVALAANMPFRQSTSSAPSWRPAA